MNDIAPHRHPAVTTWATDNQVDIVFLPTYGPWLNWIEAEFAAPHYFALNGTDHRSHHEQNIAIATREGIEALVREKSGRIRSRTPPFGGPFAAFWRRSRNHPVETRFRPPAGAASCRARTP